MNSAESFSNSYSEARTKFRDAVAAWNGTLEVIKHPSRGMDGQELSTDVAWFGRPEATRVLVLISGTHGVEGYCGSGAQVDWLRRGQAQNLPSNVGVLMIHAINPFGFEWTRRVNEDNVDPNRNWVNFSESLPKNPAYAELAEALCPSEWTDEIEEKTTRYLLDWDAAHEEGGALQRAVTAGQYTHPLGLFYGGKSPAWSRRTQTAIFEKYLARTQRVGIIDYHTGLGPWGYAERLTVWPSDSPEFKRAAAWYGAAVTSPKSGTSVSGDITGDSIEGSASLLGHAGVAAIAFEVGTAPVLEVLQALRADAWLHAYGNLQSEQGQRIKAQVRAAFYSETDTWKGMVAGQSLLACRQAIASLSL